MQHKRYIHCRPDLFDAFKIDFGRLGVHAVRCADSRCQRIHASLLHHPHTILNAGGLVIIHLIIVHTDAEDTAELCLGIGTDRLGDLHNRLGQCDILFQRQG